MPDITEARAIDPRRRRIANLFIGVFLAFQVGVPLGYYLGDRDYDERFSWRMFSTLRLRNCEITVTETVGAADSRSERRVEVERDVQVAWVRLLERMRSAVIDKYLARRCQHDEVERVEYSSSCTDTDGEVLPPVRRSLVCTEREPRAEAAP